MMSMFLVASLFSYICILLAVAFFTLLERKGLSYIQMRKGPNKAYFMGLPQPLADAAKLLVKEISKPKMTNQLPYFMAPVFSFTLALFLWELYPNLCLVTTFKLGILFFLCTSSLNVYGTLVAGWSSNSKYALLGALRAIAQTISYEVSLALIMLLPLFLAASFDFFEINSAQKLVWFMFLMAPIAFIWFTTCLAETNRAPFDFAEGESELVSGFNIEYAAGGFALIFLAEYANILVMSLFTSILFGGGPFIFVLESDFFFLMKTLFFAFVFIWVRGSYPRFRYDLLMNLAWKSFLPVSLSFLMVLFIIMCYT
uniref:NADH-ubiquinone oxidoreductase chain 1 n=1 Tax=Obscurella hidalgoi TaxID=1663726 RepID=A0A0M3WMB7_OBSHI|nr:NADH dehydrogenase subunit 1 [Obscurella hidalgoi]AKL90682.1 NADH dehydrogenase subunit 1 [Obscurella hidalgoi]